MDNDIYGHVNNALTLPGVFGHLNQVHLGDYVTVSDKDGHTLVYRVTAIDQYPADEAPAVRSVNTWPASRRTSPSR